MSFSAGLGICGAIGKEKVPIARLKSCLIREHEVATQGIHTLISPQEADRAIYLDYEGNIGRDPVLLGWMIDGALYGAVVDPTFHTCAHRYRAKHIGCADHLELVTSLVEQAETEDRKLISWSQHDYKFLCEQLGIGATTRLQGIYRNAIPTAKRWHWHTKDVAASDRSLSYFMELMGYEVPTKYGQGVVGNALRLMRHQLTLNGRYEHLSPKARYGWQSVVKHNMHDLQAMALVTLVASEGVALCL